MSDNEINVCINQTCFSLENGWEEAESNQGVYGAASVGMVMDLSRWGWRLYESAMANYLINHACIMQPP